MRFSVRTFNQTISYICVYKVETSKNVIDESVESLSSTSQAEMHTYNSQNQKEVMIAVLGISSEAVGI